MAIYKPKEITKEEREELLKQVKSGNQDYYDKLNELWKSTPSPKVEPTDGIDYTSANSYTLTEKEKLVEKLIKSGAIDIREALLLLGTPDITINTPTYNPPCYPSYNTPSGWNPTHVFYTMATI